MTDDPNTPPKLDPLLQANPHYWLYKVTLYALSNQIYQLHNMGHIWNRWSCQGLSDAEAKELGINLIDYPPLNNADKKAITDHIRNTEQKTDWDFPNLDKDIKFTDTVWEYPVNFSKFIFRASVNFQYSTFTQDAAFYQAIFIKDVDFLGATFTQSACFVEVKFTQDADFFEVKFTQDADFSFATFTQDADFFEVKFTQDADFFNATFTQNANFLNATFTGNAYFFDAHFAGNIIKFYNCTFHKPTHSDTEPKINFSFENVVFDTTVNFAESKFQHLPNMTGVDFRGGINLDGVEFPQDSDGIYANHEEKTKGGLDAINAERTWRAFSSEMEKSGNHEQAVKYFGYALDAKCINPNTDWLFKIVLGLYKKISDYGQSISKPVCCWFGLIGIFWLIYYIFLYFNNGYCGWVWDRRCDMDFSNFFISLKLAIKGAVPIVSDQTTFFDRMFKDVINGDKEVINANNVLELGIFPLLYGVQTILSLVLIFLFGLGIRHRLRLK